MSANIIITGFTKEAGRENMNEYNKFFNANRDNWNKRTEIHYKSDFYNVSGFIQSKDSCIGYLSLLKFENFLLVNP